MASILLQRNPLYSRPSLTFSPPLAAREVRLPRKNPPSGPLRQDVCWNHSAVGEHGSMGLGQTCSRHRWCINLVLSQWAALACQTKRSVLATLVSGFRCFLLRRLFGLLAKGGR